ncbi:thioesterase [Wenjunlia vitaminophila]|uniref:Acyl-coenzyme A thioesterase THEM4 n=1 Tax=Wenjunlia vitaminophila TaxID=76728 RepID=A0A0T6M092_WENVI|nr:PaaI family thioesterase [Wenjunlia vitaminophila]KRV51420.1 thioesterase [Wenjunlia vitaminophila]
MSGPTASDAPAGAALTPPPEAEEPVRHPDAPAPGTLLGSHYDQCFGCGPRHPHGLHLVSRASDGVAVTAELRLQGDHQGAPGLAHGGVLASALDEVLGAVNWMLRAVAVTRRLETDYLLPVPVDAVLHLSARCTAVHRRKIYSTAEARIGSPQGPLAVRADALYVEVPMAHFTTHGRAEDVEAVLRDRPGIAADRAFEVNP